MTIQTEPHFETSTTITPKIVHSATTAVPKRILLVDIDENSQERRAGMLRQRGAEVTCADDIEHARLLWQEDTYGLVMIDATNIHDDAIAFHKTIKDTRPKQLVKFLVGRPGLLSDSPLEGDIAIKAKRKMSAMKGAQAIFAAAYKNGSRGTGIKNATLQIAAQRSINLLSSADRAAAKGRKEISFGEAVRRAGGQ
jgi:CheY-like chemotaxis protein